MNAHSLKTTFHTSVRGRALLAVVAVSALLLAVGWLLWPSGPAHAQASNDATLKGLTISQGTLRFDRDTTTYAVTVLPPVARVTVTPSVSHPMAAATVNGADPATPVALDYGANTINVVVTAEDQQTTKTYVITVTRPRNQSANIQIAASLDLWTKEENADDVEIVGLALPAGATISPAFQTSTVSYTLTVPAEMGQLSFTGMFTSPRYIPTIGQNFGVLAVGTPAQLDPNTVTTKGTVSTVKDYVIANGENDFIKPSNFTLDPGPSTTTVVMRVYKRQSGPEIPGKPGVYWALRSNPIHSKPGNYWKDYTLTVVREQPQQSPPQQSPPQRQGLNRAPTVAAPLSDVSDLEVEATREVSLSGVFADADNDALTINATSSDATVATVSVASDYSKLTVTGVAVGAVTITVAADDGSDNDRAIDAFDVYVVKKYTSLITQMYDWRNDPNGVNNPSHIERWDRALLAMGETVSPGSLTPMTAAEAEEMARKYQPSRWNPVVEALRELEAASQPQQQQQSPQQQRVNRAPTVASALSDVSDLEVGATQEVSLSGVFSDADGDTLTINATSSDATVATASVSSDGSGLTLSGVSEGTTTITVTAQDAGGSHVSDAFEVSVVKKYTSLIAQMYDWRNGPEAQQYGKPHTDRWDRALLAFGETVADATITPMTADEAQALADQDWGVRWVHVAAALKDLESATPQPVQQQQPQQQPPQQQVNRAPTVSAAIADVTIVSESGTRTVSLSGVFADADNDALTISAGSSNEAVATVTVASDYSALTVSARARGTATITVTADDGRVGAVSDSFTVTVKAAPTVASAIADLSLELGGNHDISLSGVFDDADGDALTFSATSTDLDVANPLEFHGELTIIGALAGSATVTVTAQDSDGNSVSDEFDVTVAAPQQPTPTPTPTPEPTPTPTPEPTPTPTPTPEPETPEPSTLSDAAARYDANDDGRIDASEYRQALSDYNAGKITYAEMMEVILATFRGG